MRFYIPEAQQEQPVAVVSGATSGCGEAILNQLAESGWLTIGVARNADALQELTETSGGGYVAADISNSDDVWNTATVILEKHPAVNLLVNCAGMALRERALETPLYLSRRVMETNYHGTVHLTQTLLPGLREASPHSDIVIVGSAAGRVTNAKAAAYGASKAALTTWAQALTADLAQEGIRVHTIHPGKFDSSGHPNKSTSFLSKLTGTTAERVADAAISEIGRKPREIYVPGTLRAVGVMFSLLPEKATKIVDKVVK